MLYPCASFVPRPGNFEADRRTERERDRCASGWSWIARIAAFFLVGSGYMVLIVQAGIFPNYMQLGCRREWRFSCRNIVGDSSRKKELFYRVNVENWNRDD